MLSEISTMRLIWKAMEQMFGLERLLSPQRIPGRPLSGSLGIATAGNMADAISAGLPATENGPRGAGVPAPTAAFERHGMVVLVRVIRDTAAVEGEGSGTHINVCLN